jgi:hypothetical protein
MKIYDIKSKKEIKKLNTKESLIFLELTDESGDF